MNELYKPETVELLNGAVVKNELLLSCMESQLISIYSAAGTKCVDFELRAGEVKTINLTDYADGVYILHGSFKPIRFIKSH
jgi:hypothetical protein